MQSLPEDDYAVIFADIYKNVKQQEPSTMFSQIAAVGILTVYFLLNDREYNEFVSRKIDYYHLDQVTLKEAIEPIANQYHLKAKFINCGDVNSEDGKLAFYLIQNHDKNHLMNIYICHTPLPWVSPTLRSSFPCLKKMSTEYSFCGYSFFKKTTWENECFSLQTKSSDLAIKLLTRDQNPCYCHQFNVTDILYYQWLLNIFVELCLVEIKLEPSYNHYYAEVKQLLSTFYHLIDTSNDLEKQVVIYIDKIFVEKVSNYFTRAKYQEIQADRKNVKQEFIDTIKELMAIYKKLSSERQLENMGHYKLE